MMKYIVLLFSLLVLGCAQKKETAEPESIPAVVATPVSELPDLVLLKTDGSMANIKDAKGKTILFLFQPDCDHCQREATEIQKNLESFQQYTLYFIAADTHEKIRGFAETYKLIAPNIMFGQADGAQIVNNFGSIPTPSVYVYTETGKLIKKFNGETDIQMILQAL